MSDKQRQIPDASEDPTVEPEVFARKGGGYAGGLGSEIADPDAGPPPEDPKKREEPTD